MLCLSIAETTTTGVIQAITAHAGVADLFEIRLDLLKELDVPALTAAGKRNLVFTALGPCAGGEKPADALRSARAAGAAYVCGEPETIALLAADEEQGKCKRIAAVHPKGEAWPDLTETADRAFCAGADIAKIVPEARTLSDNFALLDFLESESRPLIAFCSGAAGVPSRILATTRGSVMTFARADDAPGTAPGQLPVSEMRTVYDTAHLKKGFQLLGVAGNPVEQSRSPALFNALFAANGVNAIYVPMRATGAEEIVEAVRSAELRGLSVTIPFKDALFDLLDGVNPYAAQSRAVNTIVNDDGQLIGYNTDTDAALDLLPSDLSGRMVTLLGSGGAAMGLAVGLVRRGANLTLCGRTPERTRTLAESVGANWSEWADREKVETDIWINATPIGMVPDVERSPLARGVLRGGETVFDLVYNPEETALLKMAWETGCTVISGLEMFLHQATAQYELWFGKRPTVEEARHALEGMP